MTQKLESSAKSCLGQFHTGSVEKTEVQVKKVCIHYCNWSHIGHAYNVSLPKMSSVMITGQKAGKGREILAKNREN